MDNKIVEILKQVFGYDDFRENQKEIIEAVLNGQDVFVLMPTASGKSLCYQIPAMIRKGVGVIVSPLIALMEDQVKALRQNGVRAAYLNSTLSFQEAQKVQRQAAAGGLDLLYVAPERLLTQDFQHYLKNIDIALFAIDEAHCVSQWGHDFRPEYLRIREVTKNFQDIPQMALTATADAVTREDILEKLDLKNAMVFISSFDRPNLFYKIQPKKREKGQLLAFLAKWPPNSAGIVYVRTRKRAENIASWLKGHGIEALAYHAGMAPDIRMENQRRFQENETRIIVATIAFGLGIDKPDVRFVVHLNLPASMEAYYQETGRAGRDGQPAEAWMVYSFSDVVTVRRFIASSEGDATFKKIQLQKIDALLGYCESGGCRREQLLSYFGEKYDGPCRACDNCHSPPQTWDGTETSQKALSCIYRTGERFGTQHLINVLMGKKTQGIGRWKHDRIKTFGAGRELGKDEWASVFRQLLSAGLVSMDYGEYGTIRLNEESWAVLKNRRKVFFKKEPSKARIQDELNFSITARQAPENPEAQELFEALRKLRLDIAKKLKVPSYFIFHDKSLKEMARVKPETLRDFLTIDGVGLSKAARFGNVFLECIRGGQVDLSKYEDEIQGLKTEDIEAENTITHEEIKQTVVALLKEGSLAAAEIAEKVGVSPPTVWAYKANLTVGKDGDEKNKEDDKNHPLEDWEPNPQVKGFITKKVRELGSQGAVDAFYKGDSRVCRYARRIATEVLAEKSREYEEKKTYLDKFREKHAKSHSNWSVEEEYELKKSLSAGNTIREISTKFERSPGAIQSRIEKLRLQNFQDEDRRGLAADCLEKRVICLAVSRKYGGYCMAGKEIAEGEPVRWVRPVSPSDSGELPLDLIKFKNGHTPCLLDMVDLVLKKPFPHYYQTENYLTDRSRPWEKAGQAEIARLNVLCDPVDALWENGYHSASGKNDRIPLEIAKEKCASSLVLIQPQNFVLWVISGLTFKRKIRAEFSYREIAYNLTVTDISVEKACADRPVGRYPVESETLFLCVSLGEPFEGFCYKLVAGVIGLPG